MKPSNFLSINWADVAKGFIVAAVSGAITGVYTALQSGTVPTLLQLKTSALVGLAAGLSYLIKNFFTVPPTA